MSGTWATEPAVELRVFFHEEARLARGHPSGRKGPLRDAVLDLLRAAGIGGATVLRGVAGYGTDGEVHRAAFLESGGIPLIVVAIDAKERIEGAAADIAALAPEALIVLQDVRIHPRTARV